MGAERDRLVEIAGLLSDGMPVDWPAEQRAAQDEEERQTLLLLEQVAHIVRAQDRLHGLSDGAATLPVEGPGPALPAPARWGRLELRGMLGQGSFAEVHRAWDPDLGREVALKLLRSDAPRDGVDAALHEGRMLARIRHPNVVTVHGAERHDGRVGVWMELVRGRTLDALRREQGTFGAREAALMGLDLCRALTAVHQAGLVHRDINSRNVMREDGGRIVLMDFGTGRDVAAAGGAATMAGTPYFMAPETLRGEPAGVQSDIYSAGVLLFHLVTGTYPVQGDSIRALRAAHAGGVATLLREARADLEPPFVRVVEKALAADPAARWATAGQMEQALAAALGVESAPAAAAPVATRVPQQRRRWAFTAAAAATVAVVAALGFMALSRREAPAPTGVGTAVPTTPLVGAPAAAAMQVQSSFYRRRGEARARVASGDPVTPGDGLTLELRSNIPVHVYVVNEDENGDTHLLFPLPGFEPANPLASGRTWVLPGTRDGTAFDWEVSSAGGRERLLVVASRERLTDLEADLLALPRAGSEAGPEYAQLSPRAVQRLRGIGALRERPAAPARPEGAARGSQLDDIAARLPAGVETAPGIWVQRVEFENPR